MYLGRALNLRTTHDTELNHRISKVCAKFGVFRKELTDKHYSLRDRLRLFNAVVTPCILYGCSSWVMTVTRERKLRAAQRKMLRAILGKGRAVIEHFDGSSTESQQSTATHDGEDLEPWVSWIQRVTHEALESMSLAGVPEWVDERRRRKWRWCGHVCRRHDGRWTSKVLRWEPHNGSRNRGHPFGRWFDDVGGFFQMLSQSPEQSNYSECAAFAQSREVWSQLETDYLNYCCKKRD